MPFYEWPALATPELVPNMPLLHKVLDHVDAHPEEWDQRSWGYHPTTDDTTACDTAFCIAGHAVNLSGAELIWSGIGLLEGARLTPGGQAIGVSAAAKHLLGLTFSESHALFDAENTRARVQEIAEQIAARAGERL